MNRFFTFICLFLLSYEILAQIPQSITYQAIIRGSDKNLLVNKSIGNKINIIQGSPSGTIIYQETQNVLTNLNGLVTFEIGTGSTIVGDFKSIDWSLGSYFIKIETDPLGGTNYSLSSTSKLNSVPFSLYSGLSKMANSALISDSAKVAGSVSPNFKFNSSQINASGATNGQVLKWDGTNWKPDNDNTGTGTADNWGTQTVVPGTTLVGNGTSSNPLNISQQGATAGQVLRWSGGAWLPATLNASYDGDSSSTNEIQTISKSGNTISLSKGGGSITVGDADTSVTNEIQTISRTNGTINLSNGGGSISLPDSSAINEIQFISISNDTIRLSNGGFIKLPANNNWNITGNSNIDSSKFIGTTTNQALNFRVNNTPSGKIDFSKRLTSFGIDAGMNASTNSSNSFFGYQAGKNNNNGQRNTAIGSDALKNHSGGGLENVAIGFSALSSSTNVGDNNVAIGALSLDKSSGSGNTAVGYRAMTSSTTSDGNTALGQFNMFNNLSGNKNTSIGFEAFYFNESGSKNTAIGNRAGYLNKGSNNVFLGTDAGYNDTSSNKLYIANHAVNTLIYGDFANKSVQINDSLSSKYFKMTNGANNGYVLQSDSFGNGKWVNLSVGNTWNITGNANTDSTNFIGPTNYKPLIFKIFGFQSGFIDDDKRMTTFGYNSGKSNVSASGNTFIGWKAGRFNTTAINNTVLGANAFTANSGFSNYNVAIGSNSMSLSTSIGLQNIGLGAFTLNRVTGNDNIALGFATLDELTTGNSNIGMGKGTFNNLVSGNLNTAIGHEAMFNNFSGSNNTAIGQAAGYTNKGSNNVFIGSFAGYNDTTNDKLYISNSQTNNLITGDFSTKSVHINDSLTSKFFRMTYGATQGFIMQTDSLGRGYWVNKSSILGTGLTTNYMPKWNGSNFINTGLYADNNGRYSTGTTNTNFGGNFNYAKWSLVSDVYDTSDFNLIYVGNNSSSTWFNMGKARGTKSAMSPVQIGDELATISANGYDGFTMVEGGYLGFMVDDSVKSGKMPTSFYLTLRDTSGNSNERLTITSSKYLGINNTEPLRELDVVGSIRSINPGASPTGSSIDFNSPAGDPGIIMIRGNGTGTSAQRWDTKIASDSSYRISSTVGTTATNRIVLKNNGNTGIGTTTPNSTLEVSGPVGLKTVVAQVAGTNHPDNTAGIWIYSSGTGSINLPSASTCANRMYILINNTGASRNISSFQDVSNTAQTSLGNNTTTWLISDGTSWRKIN